MKKIIIASLMVVPFISIAETTTLTEQSSFGATAKIGTLGAGLDLTYNLSPKLNARFNVNGLNKSFDEVKDGVSYKGNLDLFTVGALLDFHPFENGFRLSAGLYNNKNKIKGRSENANNALIGHTAYDIAGTLDSDIGFKSTAPYLGVGWGNAVKGHKNWHFSVDAGILFQGTPESKLTGAGVATPVGVGGVAIDVASDSAFQQELQREQNNLNDDLKDFKYYPVLSVGLSYSIK